MDSNLNPISVLPQQRSGSLPGGGWGGSKPRPAQTGLLVAAMADETERQDDRIWFQPGEIAGLGGGRR
jgi:hypothetical protein